MKSELVNTITTKSLSVIFVLMIIYCLNDCASFKPVGETTIIVTRAGTLMDDGKLYVYIDGKQLNKNQPIGKGQTRTFLVSNGRHNISVKIDRLESGRIQFTAEKRTINFNVSTERVGGSKTLLIAYNIAENNPQDETVNISQGRQYEVPPEILNRGFTTK
jgi:hypothetical protein